MNEDYNINQRIFVFSAPNIIYKWKTNQLFPFPTKNGMA